MILGLLIIYSKAHIRSGVRTQKHHCNSSSKLEIELGVLFFVKFATTHPSHSHPSEKHLKNIAMVNIISTESPKPIAFVPVVLHLARVVQFFFLRISKYTVSLSNLFEFF